jgi:hypothetical protein
MHAKETEFSAPGRGLPAPIIAEIESTPASERAVNI